ncbi:MAG: hypothetical protein MUP70_04420 [Candidatus Aminicenantes bacterium]|nr:hypothetical protein [Candidatus Aminicenantes bacterium]
MEGQIKVKDIMIPIEEYDKVDIDARLCDVLGTLQKNNAAEMAGERAFHKTVFVTDQNSKIVGMIAMYHLIRGLVPESAKKSAMRAYHPVLSARAKEVAEEIAEIQERFLWLDHTFRELVRQEAQTKVRDMMGPVEEILKEDDTLNWAIYAMFRADVREPLVVREGKVVGVLNLMVITRALLEVIGPQCEVLFES